MMIDVTERTALRDNLFVWDDNKNTINMKKHGVSFEEALTVFGDNNAIFIADEAHSEYEDRFLVIGRSGKTRLLVVCHCNMDDERIRIITARKANKRERSQYEGRYK